MVDPVSIGKIQAVELRVWNENQTKVTQATTEHKVSGPVQHSLGQSTIISLAHQLADQGPPIDHEKVERLREAVASGSYEIDSESIARAMLDFAGTGTE